MSKIELYIDSQIIDLEESQEIAQTFQINEFFDISDRQANFTNRFSVPPTARNLQVFDRLGIVGNTTRFPYQIHDVYLTVDGLPLISNGTAKLKKFKDAEGYELYIYSGVNSIFEQIEDRTLADLNLSDLTHNFNLLELTDSFSNTEGYVYPLYDSGKQDFPSGALIADSITPAVFLHTLWDKVFTEAGFTYSGGVFSESSFLSQIITPNNPLILTGANIFGADFLDLGVSTSDTFDGDPIPVVFTSVDDYLGLLEGGNERFTIPKDGSYSVDVSVTFDFTDDELLDEMIVRIFAEPPSSSAVEIDSFVVDSKTFGFSDSYAQSYIGGTDIYIVIESDTGTPLPGYNFQYSVDVTVNGTTQENEVDFTELFADGLTQKEFIKDTLQQFGLILKRTPNSNNYEFIQIEQLLQDRSNAVDFTEKFNRRNSQTYSIDSLAQFNYFKYSYPEENETFADASIYVDNETLPLETTLIESAMNASKLTGKTLTPDESRELYQVPFFAPETGGQYSAESPGSHVFEVAPESITLNYTVEDGFFTAVFNGSVPFADFTNLSYTDVIDSFYSRYAAILNSPVREEIELHLDAIDVYKFDFFKLIYIAQLGHYYYVERIKDFIPSKLTKLDVVRVVS